MDIYAFDAFCPKEVIEKDGVKAVSSAEELYAACNIAVSYTHLDVYKRQTIIYASIMVVIVAFLLAFVSSSLKEKQYQLSLIHI